ncbi:MAG: 2-dehydropantoate 2-reductase [Gorillibacterium sp.]|nr:2-dehydropantoate 2-reductase [Gorillibacterium sp.]
MRIHIIGAGALGMLYGGKIANHCLFKLFTHTEEQAKIIKDESLVLTSLTGEVGLSSLAVSFFDQEDFISGEKPDWIFLMVKQKDLTDEVIHRISQGMGDETNLLCFQNGMGHAEKLAAYVPNRQLWLAVTTEAARKSSTNTVLHTGQGSTIFGPAFTEASEDRGQEASRLILLMESAMLLFEFSVSMEKAVWEKLIVNAVINPLSALLRVPNGELCHEEERIGLMKDLFTEAMSISEAEGVLLSCQLWDKILAICHATALNRSSMLQDVEGGRVTENEWISGAILRLARIRRIETPITDVIYRLIRTIDQI